MRLCIVIFFCFVTIVCDRCTLISASPMSGNVRPAQPGEYNFIVSLMDIVEGHHQSGGRHFCTGILITRLDVLTSAHCVETERLDRVQLVVGTVDITNGSISRPLWWQSYDQWCVSRNITIEFNWNDLADIRLIEAVSQTIVPVRLSRLHNADLYDQDVILAGWGLYRRHIPDVMKVGELKVLHNRACERKLERQLGRRTPVNIRLLCTHITPYVVAEAGDSGAPLLHLNKLSAITHGTCPDHHSKKKRINLHFGIDEYRDYIEAMKNAP